MDRIDFFWFHWPAPLVSLNTNTQRRHADSKRTWKKSGQPTWITEKEYLEQIQPRLAEITLSVLSSTLGVSEPYAVDIRAGRRVPHPRHWQTLAGLVGVESKGS